MLKNLSKLVLMCCVLPSVSCAGWYGGGEVGMGNTQQSFNTTLTYDAPLGVLFNYQSQPSKNESILYGLFIGKTFWEKENTTVGAGIEGDIIVHNHFRGITTDDVTGTPTTLRYNFSANSYLFLLRGDVRHQLNRSVSLFALVNIGGAVNHLYYYNENIISPTATVQAPFRSNSQTKFAFGVGVGGNIKLSSKSQLGIGLRYINSGKAAFRTSVSQVNGTALGTKALESKLITLSYRYS